MRRVYDVYFNRTAQNVVKGSVPVQSISVDMNTNRVTSWSYDANGNATSISGVATITYDASNRVKTVGGETYEYDPSNKRIWKNDTFTFWGGKGERVGTYSVTLMSDTTGSPTQWKLAFVKQTEDWYFGGRRLNQVQDRLGSERSGGKSYYPYGEEGTATANPADKFATYHRDGTGLDYADQRYYASGSGRFITSDPYQASGLVSKPTSWNRYTYVESDPANSRDRRGLARDCDPNNFRDPTSATLFCPPDGGGGRIDNGTCVVDGLSLPCSLAARFYAMGASLTYEQYQAWWPTVSRPQPAPLVVNLPPGATALDTALAYISALGLNQFIDVNSLNAEPNGNGFTFRLLPGVELSSFLSFLGTSPYFASGPWGLMHVSDVGFPPTDFRSFTYDGAPLSMQINTGPNGMRFDFDLANPYQDIVDLWRHFGCEVMHLCQP